MRFVSESVHFKTLKSMRRSLVTLAFALLFVVGVSDVKAQSADQALNADALTTSPQPMATVQQSAVLKSDQTPSTINTRTDIQRAMLADMAVPATEGPASMQTDGNSNRRLLYIAGGTLVAAGITAAIILLLDGGGEDGIPGPPGRPSGQ